MRLSAQTVRDRLRAAFGADAPPGRIAAAWALGIGIGLSPLLGLHTVLAVVLALVFRLNKVDVLLGTMVSNPWVLTFYFPACVMLGQWLLGFSVPRVEIPELHQLLSAAAWREQGAWLKPLLLAWTAGSTAATAVGAALAFVVVRGAVVAHRERRARRERS